MFGAPHVLYVALAGGRAEQGGQEADGAGCRGRATDDLTKGHRSAGQSCKRAGVRTRGAVVLFGGRPWTCGPEAPVHSSINGGRSLGARTAVWVEAMLGHRNKWDHSPSGSYSFGSPRSFRTSALANTVFSANAIATPLLDQLYAFAIRLPPAPPCQRSAAFRPRLRVAAPPFSQHCVANHSSAGRRPVLRQAVAPAAAPTPTATAQGGSGSGGASAARINN